MFRPLSAHDLVNFYRSYGNEFIKGSGAVTSSTPNLLNRVYGSLLWYQMNRRANALSILPTSEYPHSGWRVIPSMWATKQNIIPSSETDLGNVVFPDIVNLSTQPYPISQVAEISDVAEALSAVRDDVALEVSTLRVHLGVGVLNALNQQILHPITSAPLTGAWTSLDWIVAKHNEQGKNAGWGNTIFGVDRSVNAWANAYVDDSATLRALTKNMLTDALTAVRTEGGEPSCWLAHPAGVGVIQKLFDSQVLYSIIGEKQIKVDVNGISTYDGHGVGLTVSTLFGYPIIPDAFVAKGASDVGRIYLLSMNNEQGIGPELTKTFLIPFTAYESRDYVNMNKAVIRMAYRCSGDIVARRFNVHAKIRDIT